MLSNDIREILEDSIKEKIEHEKSLILNYLSESARAGHAFVFYKFAENDPALYYFIDHWLWSEGFATQVISRFHINDLPSEIIIFFVDFKTNINLKKDFSIDG